VTAVRRFFALLSLFAACATAACGPMGTEPPPDDAGAGGSTGMGGSTGTAGGPIADSAAEGPVVSNEFVPRPEFAGPCAATQGAVDVDLGNAPEAFVRAAYCQVNGSEPPAAVVDMWTMQLRTVPYVRRIDVVRTICRDAGRTCTLSYSDPWATDVPLDAPCRRKTNRDMGAVFMFFSECPGGTNCAMDWANTHAAGMAAPAPRLAFGTAAAGYYNARNAGFWYRELLDARWSGLQFLLLNVYGPDLARSPDPLATLGQALAQAGTDVKIALMDDPWAWGKASSPAEWRTAPSLSNADAAAQTLYQAKWKPFYTRVPRDAWYLYQNRPFIYFYNAGTLTPLNVSAAVVGRLKQLFQQDFGVMPFVAVDNAYFQDPAMPTVADARFTWDTITRGKSRQTLNGVTLDHFMVKWDSIGRDMPGAIATSATRMIKGTSLLEQMLASSLDAQIAMIATWNDLGEGTGIERNYDYYAEGAWLPPNAFMGRIRASQCE
jgi:hypothetical protein